MNKLTFPFQKANIIIILAGLVVLLIGYMLLSGGGSDDPNVFNADELFSSRRITLAPIVIILGYITVGIGIMFRSKKSEA
jgi:preprotein translocase subunit SecG